MKRFSVLVSIMAVSAIVLATAKAPASQVVHEPSQLNLTIPLMAERREPDRPAPRPAPRPIDPVTGYPIVNGDTWMTEPDVPWSTLVVVQSAQGDSAVAVLDRFYEEGFAADFRNPGIASQWQRDRLEVYGYGLWQTCYFAVVCDVEHPIYPVTGALLKVGDRVFPLRGKQTYFAISDQVAWALKTAPPQQVWLQVAIAGGSNYATRPIGAATIAAWASLYQDAEPPGVAALPEANLGPMVRLPAHLPDHLPVIEETRWRTQSDVLCSQPVIVHDDFNGDYLAVLDRAYSLDGWSGTSTGILTNWSADAVAIHLYETTSQSYTAWAVNQIVLELGEQTFVLTGINNRFAISDELARALASPPATAPRISYGQINGDISTRSIGAATVSVWPLIYAPPEE
jgi:hypothetical protein